MKNQFPPPGDLSDLELLLEIKALLRKETTLDPEVDDFLYEQRFNALYYAFISRESLGPVVPYVLYMLHGYGQWVPSVIEGYTLALYHLAGFHSDPHHAKDLPLREMENDAPIDNFDPNYADANLSGWLGVTLHRFFSNHIEKIDRRDEGGRRIVHIPHSDDGVPLPSFMAKTAWLDPGPGIRLDPSGHYEHTIDLDQAVRGAALYLDLPEVTDLIESQERFNACVKLVFGLLSSFKEDLGKSDSGIYYADVVQQVYVPEAETADGRISGPAPRGRKTKRDNRLHNELPGAPRVPKIRQWARRGIERLSRLVEDQFQDSDLLLPLIDYVLGRHDPQ